MKAKLIALFLGIFLVSIFQANSQTTPVVDKKYKEEVVDVLSKLLVEHYVYEDVAQKTAKHLKKQSEAGQFTSFKDLESFAEALTKEVQSVNKDKHMRIRPMRPRKAPENTPARLIENQLDRIQYRREVVAGFREARKIDGNIGYLDLRGFAGLDWGGPMADHYMHLLGTSDAMIVDLRKNGGGSPAMVQYLCSYFFDERTHLNSLYWRKGDRTEEFWTLDEVGGEKMGDVPLFVLTSSRTFSGAEEFAYNMQTRKRATLVGETTGGGANPGGGFRINNQLTIFIPTGAAVNPVTGTNWEGVGVVPEVKTSAEEALDKAIELATVAAEEYRNKTAEKHKKLLTGLQSKLAQLDASASKTSAIEQLEECHKAGLLKEGDINMLGYEYLQGLGNPHAAEALFKGNILLFPESVNVYDSYAEALVMNGKEEKALKNYEKAVELAKKQAHPNIEVYKENLEKAKAKFRGQ